MLTAGQFFICFQGSYRFVALLDFDETICIFIFIFIYKYLNCKRIDAVYMVKGVRNANL